MARTEPAKHASDTKAPLAHFLILGEPKALRSGMLALVEALNRQGKRVVLANPNVVEFHAAINGGGMLLGASEPYSLRPKKTCIIPCLESLDEQGWQLWMRMEQAKLASLNASAAVRLCLDRPSLSAVLQQQGIGHSEAPLSGGIARFWLFAQRQGLVRRDLLTLHSRWPEDWTDNQAQEAQRLAVEAAKRSGCLWAEVLVSHDHSRFAVLHIQPQPGIFPAEAPGLAGNLAELLTQRLHAPLPKTCIGFRERIFIAGVGEVVAKFDTGNGATACSLHADHIEEVDGYLEWSLGSQQHRHPVVGHSFAEVGHSVQRRPVILLTVQFNGMEYRKVRFALVNRTKKSTPVLANRQFMRRAGLLVDPAEEFMVSWRPEGYCPKDAKGQARAGILPVLAIDLGEGRGR